MPPDDENHDELACLDGSAELPLPLCDSAQTHAPSYPRLSWPMRVHKSADDHFHPRYRCAMTVNSESGIPAGALRDVTAAPRADHELISFAVFLEYRARRMRAPLASMPAPDAPAGPVDIEPVES